MSSETLVEEWLPTITGMAAGLARAFPTSHRDDLSQEMLLWLITHKVRIGQWRNDLVDEPGAMERMVGRSLLNHGLAWCHKEKATADGYDIEDLFFYSKATLRELLDVVWDFDSWLEVSPEEHVTTTRSDPATGGNRLALIIDVTRGLDRLSAADTTVLSAVHRDRMAWDELAAFLDTTTDAVRKRYQRAVGRLQGHLGGERPDFTGIGSRRVISNSAAQALTSHQEAGE